MRFGRSWDASSANLRRSDSKKGGAGIPTPSLVWNARKLVVAWHLRKQDRVNAKTSVPRFVGQRRRGGSMGAPMPSSPTRRLSTLAFMIARTHSRVVKLLSNSMQPVPESYKPAKFVSVAKRSKRQPRLGLREYLARRAQERNTSPMVQEANAAHLCVL